MLERALVDGSRVLRGAFAVAEAQAADIASLRADVLLRAALATDRRTYRPEHASNYHFQHDEPGEKSDPGTDGHAAPTENRSDLFHQRSGAASVPSVKPLPTEAVAGDSASGGNEPIGKAPFATPETKASETNGANGSATLGPDSTDGDTVKSGTARPWKARERAVPESPLSRVMGFGALGAGLVVGAAAESLRRATGFSSPSTGSHAGGGDVVGAQSSAFVNDANAERLARSLSRMRGAALKLGQMLSIQDERVIPAPLQQALERVRQGADIMPQAQLRRVLQEQYGQADDADSEAWMSRLGVLDFDYQPMAAASIGQVHKAVRREEDGQELDIAMKIQYPGVARSIASDISNIKRLVTMTGFVPEKYFIDEALVAAKEELERECDYKVEAANQSRFRKLVLASEELRRDFYVPAVIAPLSTESILASEFVKGVPIDRVTDPKTRSWIASRLLRMTLAELFEFRFMQTDPNFSNFLFGHHEDGRPQIYLIDFGAARAYDPIFVANYFDLIVACADKDRNAIIDQSVKLGFLTGEENRTMLDAHVKASVIVGEPFSESGRGGYDFTKNDIPARTAEVGKVMLEHRLTPPPQEAYSLHRRLSGAFLTATRLSATIDCHTMLADMKLKMADVPR